MSTHTISHIGSSPGENILSHWKYDLKNGLRKDTLQEYRDKKINTLPVQ